MNRRLIQRLKNTWSLVGLISFLTGSVFAFKKFASAMRATPRKPATVIGNTMLYKQPDII